MMTNLLLTTLLVAFGSARATPFVVSSRVTNKFPSVSVGKNDKSSLTLDVIDGFLSNDQEIEALLAMSRDESHVASSTGNLKNKFATVGAAFVHRILGATSHLDSTKTCSAEHDASCNVFSSSYDDSLVHDDTTVQMRTIHTGSTPLHQDRYWDEEHTLVEDTVGFVFLNDNPAANFHHGSNKVPVKKGNLVLFNGSVPHQTIVKSGLVHLLGPFHVSPSMEFVGATACSAFSTDETSCLMATFANGDINTGACCECSEPTTCNTCSESNVCACENGGTDAGICSGIAAATNPGLCGQCDLVGGTCAPDNTGCSCTNGAASMADCDSIIDPSDGDCCIFALGPPGTCTGATTTCPSEAPSSSPSSTPSASPSDVPSSTPSASPSDVPSASPSDVPSGSPSDVPSASPSDVPSSTPSASPSDVPSASPSDAPSSTPSASPSDVPSATPSASPSDVPSASPSDVPSATPSARPSEVPSASPSTSTPSMTPVPTGISKSTKAPSFKGTKAPSAPTVKGTKAPSGGSKGTKAPSAPTVKGTKAPSFKGTKAPSAPTFKSTKAPSAPTFKGSKSDGALLGALEDAMEEQGIFEEEDAATVKPAPVAPPPGPVPVPEPAPEPVPAPLPEETEEDPNIVYIAESNENQQGLSTQAMVGTAFAVLLTVVLCVNVAFLYLFCRARGNGSGNDGGGDPYGTTVTVQHLKGGRVLVKKTIPLEDGTEVVQKTVYPDRESAAGHGFVPDLY